jgi:hypothetical protein
MRCILRTNITTNFSMPILCLVEIAAIKLNSQYKALYININFHPNLSNNFRNETNGLVDICSAFNINFV